MREVKTLANCTPTEFLAQTFSIAESATKWLNDIDVKGILGRKTVLTEFPQDASEEEKEAIRSENREAIRTQTRKNIMELLKAAMVTHGKETIEILALCCFIDPREAENYKPTYYMAAVTSLISDKDVIDFFVSLAHLGQMNIFEDAKA
jgi:hypothetical protein